jgi:hypothetical protein
VVGKATGVGVLRIESKQTEVRDEVLHERTSDGEGLMFLGVLVGSWMIAIAVGWLLWRVAPL